MSKSDLDDLEAIGSVGEPERFQNAKPLRDPRIRHEVGHFRVVAPDGKLQGKGGVFYCNGRLVLEKATRDSLGNLTWVFLQYFEKPVAFLKGTDADIDRAVYAIMAGEGAADAT